MRHTLRSGPDRFGLDVFWARHRGLAVVEVELHPGSDPEPPGFAGPEVTGEDHCSGGRLAYAGDDELDRLRRSSGIPSDP